VFDVGWVVKTSTTKPAFLLTLPVMVPSQLPE